MADDNLERITILLQARDKDLARSLDRMNRQVARFTRDSERNTARMQQRVEGHFSQMGQSVLGFGRNLATGFAVGAATTALGVLTTNLRGTVRNIAAVGDEARRAGVGVEEFQQWAYVAEQNRIGVDALVDGLKELNLRADEFVTTGAGSAAEAFARLGYDARTLRTALEDPSELMLDIIDRMQNMDRAAQIRVADEVFGGTAGERFVELLAQGEQGLRRTMQRAREVGAVMESDMIQSAADLDRRFSELTTTVGNFGKRVAVEFAEALAEAMRLRADIDDVFRNPGQADALAGEDVADALRRDGRAALEAADSAAQLRQEYERLGDRADILRASLTTSAAQLRAYGYDDAATAVGEAAAEMEILVGQMQRGEVTGEAFQDRLDGILANATNAFGALEDGDRVEFTAVTAALEALALILETTRGRAAATVTEMRRIAGLADEMPDNMTRGTPLDANGPLLPGDADMTSSPRPRPAPRDIDFGLPGTGSGDGGGSTDGYRGAVEDIQARTRALELEAAALVAAADSNQEYGAAIEYARVRAQLMNDATAEGRTITPELQAEIDALAEAYVTAGANAEEAADRMRQVQEDARRGADAIGSIFDAILEGGDAARNAIARLLQQMASSAFQRLLMGMTGSGGGGVLSMIGGLLGGKRAGGGGVMAGVPYQVNENTPNSEIFIPSRSGGVLNVAQAKDAMRGAGQAGGRLEVGVTVSVDRSGNLQAFVDDRAGRAVRSATPGIVQSSVAATHSSFAEHRPK